MTHLVKHERPVDSDSMSEHWKHRDQLEQRIVELERKAAMQSDVIHMLVQGYTALLRLQNAGDTMKMPPA